MDEIHIPDDLEAVEADLAARHERELAKRYFALPRWLVYLIMSFLVLVIAANTAQYIGLFGIANDNREVLTKTLIEKDTQIGQQKVVIDQAVVYVTVMGQLLGPENSPLVLLDPSRPVPTPEQVLATIGQTNDDTTEGTATD